MSNPPKTAFANVLAQCRQTDRFKNLAEVFFDQSVSFRLDGVRASVLPELGAHIRRSFLGALGVGASKEAQAGKPCSWDPPSALDVFCREQLRGARGDGLPKPYVIECAFTQEELVVTLRVFGMANDWFMTAAEAMSAGMRGILPWERILPGRKSPPDIISRNISTGELRSMPVGVRSVRLVFTSPADAVGPDLHADPHRILTRLQRRVDGISRWNGVGLSDEAGRALAAHAKDFIFDTSGLRAGHHQSPNARGQTRRKNTMTGIFQITGDISSIWPLLAMGEKCHLGRGAVEGLGAFRLEI